MGLNIVNLGGNSDRYTLAEIEEQIFQREGIRVVFRAENAETRAIWRSYTYDRALAKSSSMAVFHQRISNYADGVPYVVIDGRGKKIMNEDMTVGMVRSSYR